MQVKHLLLIAILALTAACSSNKETVDENLSESQLYQQAQDDLNNKSYNSAVTKLKALESRYPFGRYAEQAQLELIYANYKNMEPEAARAAAERFIRLHPQHPNVDYAYYLKGLSSFDQDRGLLARFLPLDMTKRDPGAARDSFNEFAQLTSRFPNSRYAPDAKARMVYLRNLLAAYEVHVGHYYLKRQAYVAAANRGRYVVENFQKPRPSAMAWRSWSKPTVAWVSTTWPAPAWKPSSSTIRITPASRMASSSPAKARPTPAPGWPRPPWA